jgi:hypothetical protein
MDFIAILNLRRRLLHRDNVIMTGIIILLLIISLHAGAQPLGQLTFKGSHNSYDKAESITSQIDDWNVWFVEIDICKENDLLNVKHLCSNNDYGLDALLQGVKNAAATRERLTFLWFDIKGHHLVFCECEFDADRPYEVIDLLVPRLEHYFGNALYTASEWKHADGKTWPTYQELMARGKRYIAVFDEDDAKPDDAHLFMSAESYADATSTEKFPAQHIAFINRDGPDTDGVSINLSDQFLWRSYGLNDQEDWNEAADLGFSILCTDEVEQFWSFMRVQAPSPLVVNNAAAGPEYGTFGNPAHSIHKVLPFQHILPGTQMLIHAGMYDEPTLLINRKLQIVARDRSVEIR